MTVLRRGWSALEPLALQTITLANSTAISTNSTTQAAHVLHFSVEDEDVRYRSDGTDPTLTTGVLLQKDFDYWFLNYNGNSDLAIQRTTGRAKLLVQPFKYDAE